MAESTGYDWGQWIGPLVSAGAGYLAAEQQNRAARGAAQAAGGPTNQAGSSTTYQEAHPDAFPWLSGAFQQIADEYTRAQNTPVRGGGGYKPQQYQGFDFGSVDFGGPTQSTRDLQQAMADRAMGGSSFVSAAQQQLLGQLGQGGPGGGGNPYDWMAEQAFGAAGQLGQGGNAQRFIDEGFAGGFSPEAGLYGDWLARVRGGGGGGGSQATGSPGGSGSPAALSSPVATGPAPAPAPRTANMAQSFSAGALEGAGLSSDPNAWARASAHGGAAPAAPPPAQPAQGATPGDLTSGPSGPNPPETAPAQPGLYAGQGPADTYRNPALEEAMTAMIRGDYLDPAKNPYGSQYLDILDRRNAEAATRAQSSAAAQAASASALGSSFYSKLAQDVASATGQAGADARTSALFGMYGDERDRQLQAMGLASGRDAQRWGDETARYGIDKQSEAANLAASVSGAAGAQNAKLAEERLALERLGLELGGIGQFGEGSRAGVGLLGGMINTQLGAQGQGAGMMGDLAMGMGGLGLNRENSAQGYQLGLLGLVPGLEGAAWTGYESAMGGGLAADQLGSQAGQAEAGARMQDWQLGQQWTAQERARAAASDQRAREQARAQPGQDLDSYLRRLLAVSGGIGGVGGSQSSQVVTSPTPYAPQIDPYLAALQRGVGGYLAQQPPPAGGG